MCFQDDDISVIWSSFLPVQITANEYLRFLGWEPKVDPRVDPRVDPKVDPKVEPWILFERGFEHACRPTLAGGCLGDPWPRFRSPVRYQAAAPVGTTEGQLGSGFGP